MRLIRVQAARLVANTTFVSVYPVLVQSVTSLVINTDHSFNTCSVASSSLLSCTHTSIPVSFRPVVVFLLLHLHVCLTHSVPRPSFHRPSLWL